MKSTIGTVLLLGLLSASTSLAMLQVDTSTLSKTRQSGGREVTLDELAAFTGNIAIGEADYAIEIR